MKKNFKLIPFFLLTILLIGIDQITKYWAIENLKNKNSIILIPKVFQLTYLENKGAAFGIFQNQRIFFVLTTIILISIMIYFLMKFPFDKKFIPIKITLIFIASGGLGNLIDRIQYGYVIDFLYFTLINFPIFNVADCYVSVAIIVLIILILFYYKEHELKLK